jgi:hypothetical protein
LEDSTELNMKKACDQPVWKNLSSEKEMKKYLSELPKIVLEVDNLSEK